jgi:cytochrome c553
MRDLPLKLLRLHPTRFLGALAMAALFVAVGCDEPAPKGVARGEELFATCAACHGPTGTGNAEFLAPAIAGLEVWYLERQLHNFKSGVRGAHPDDMAGMRMHPMARHLKTDDDIASVAEYVASMQRGRPETTLTGGDAAKGKTSFAICVTCHLADGSGKKELNAPSLNRTNDWYLLAQLKKFKSGVRGGNAKDIYGSQMKGMAATLADEQAMKDVVAYIGTLSN